MEVLTTSGRCVLRSARALCKGSLKLPTPTPPEAKLRHRAGGAVAPIALTPRGVGGGANPRSPRKEDRSRWTTPMATYDSGHSGLLRRSKNNAWLGARFFLGGGENSHKSGSERKTLARTLQIPFGLHSPSPPPDETSIKRAHKRSGAMRDDGRSGAEECAGVRSFERIRRGLGKWPPRQHLSLARDCWPDPED